MLGKKMIERGCNKWGKMNPPIKINNMQKTIDNFSPAARTPSIVFIWGNNINNEGEGVWVKKFI